MLSFATYDAAHDYIRHEFERGDICDAWLINRLDGAVELHESVDDEQLLMTVPDNLHSVELYILEKPSDACVTDDIVFSSPDGVVTLSVILPSDLKAFIRCRKVSPRFIYHLGPSSNTRAQKVYDRSRAHFRWMTRFADKVSIATFTRDIKDENHVDIVVSCSAPSMNRYLIHHVDEVDLEQVEMYEYTRDRRWALVTRPVRPRLVTTVVYDTIR